MKNSITKKLIFYFSLALLTFALIIGTVFSLLFANTMREHNRSDLERRANMIAGTLSNFLEGIPVSARDSAWHGHNQGNASGGFSAFLKLVDDIAMGEVWLVDKDFFLITNDNHGSPLSYDALPADGDGLIRSALLGSTGFSESFSQLLGTKSFTVCVPAVDSAGTVQAAVLLHAPALLEEASIRGGILILLLSLCIALLLSTLVAIILSRRFSRPIQSINHTAGQLALGDYRQKTSVRQKDEIGALAGTIDQLSGRLLEGEKQRIAMEQERQSFYADVSHELRTPVTVIRGSLEALQDGKIPDPQKQQAYFAQMIAETQYMQNMVNDLLDFSKLKNTDYVLETQLLNISDVVSDAVRSSRPIAEKKQVAINLENGFPVIRQTGSYEKLRQMFLIVLSNAVKFSPEGEEIVITVTAANNRHTVCIADRGPGISQEDLPYIFDRFYRESSVKNNGGTGIGLAIAKQIAHRHNIEIHVESEKGQGSRFLFLLPC